MGNGGDAMRLHLAPGSHRLDGWTHIDIRPETKPNVVGDVANLSAYEDNTVDEIYASHVLDHFPLSVTYGVLEEWVRVLKSRGTLWVAVPDFRKLALFYTGGVHLERLRGMLYGGQSYAENFHFTAWDYETLACQLRQCGFYDIRRDPFDWLPQPSDYLDFSTISIDGIFCGLNVRASAR